MATTAYPSAVDAPNQSIEVGGRRLAYRSIGQGQPIVLCTRFRGTMDVWDPAFLDALAAQGLRAITFDYSGLGLSTGERSFDPQAMARDARDLIAALDLREAVVAGWSLGGMAPRSCGPRTRVESTRRRRRGRGGRECAFAARR